MAPSTLAISASHEFVIRNPLDESTNHCSQLLFNSCRTNNRSGIDEHIGLGIIGKMVTMHTHSWRTGEFHSHTRRRQRSRIIARAGHFVAALTGLDRQPGLPCERHYPNVAVTTSPTRATHMGMAEVDDRGAAAVAIRRLRRKCVRAQADQTVREIGTAQTVSSSIGPNKGINVVKHGQKASFLFLSPAVGTFRSNL